MRIPLKVVMVGTTIAFVGMVLGGYLPALDIARRTSDDLVQVVSMQSATGLQVAVSSEISQLVGVLYGIAPTIQLFPSRAVALSMMVRILLGGHFTDYVQLVSRDGTSSFALRKTEQADGTNTWQFNVFERSISPCRMDYALYVNETTSVITQGGLLNTFCGYSPLQEHWMDTVRTAVGSGLTTTPIVPLAGMNGSSFILLSGANLFDSTGNLIGWIALSHDMKDIYDELHHGELAGRSVAILMDGNNSQYLLYRTGFLSPDNDPVQTMINETLYDTRVNRPNVTYYYYGSGTPLPQGHPLRAGYVQTALNAFRQVLLNPNVRLSEDEVLKATVSDPDSARSKFNCNLFCITNPRLPQLNLRLLVITDSLYYTKPIANAQLSIGITMGVLFLIVLIVQTGLQWEVAASIKNMANVVHETVTKTGRRKSKTGDAEEERKVRKSMITEIAEMQDKLEHFGQSMNQYVPTEVVAELILSGRPAEVYMTPTNAVILFVDIEGFTKMCETLEPVDLSDLLAYYYEEQCKTVAEHGGVVDKFIGDCVMALWGAPRVVDCPDLRGVCAGLHLRDNMKRPGAREIQSDLGVDIKVRVGIAKGTVLAGSMGSSTRLAYTVLGDPVNLAARLEAANKKFGTRILINGAVMEGCLRDEHLLRLVYRDLGTVQVYGKDNAERVFQVIGVRRGIQVDEPRMTETRQETTSTLSATQQSQQQTLRDAEDTSSVTSSKSSNRQRARVVVTNPPQGGLLEVHTDGARSRHTGSSNKQLSEGAINALNDIREKAAELTWNMQQVADAALLSFTLDERQVRATEHFNAAVGFLLQGAPDQAAPLFLSSATLHGKQDKLCSMMLDHLDAGKAETLKDEGATPLPGVLASTPREAMEQAGFSDAAPAPSHSNSRSPTIFHLESK